MTQFAVRKGSSLTSLMVQALDFLAVCAGGWLAYQIRFAEHWYSPVDVEPAELVMINGTALVTTLLLGSLYRMWTGGALTAMVARVTVGWVVTWVMLVVLLALTKSAESFSRVWLVTWLATGTVTLWTSRLASYILMARLRKAGYQHKSVLLIGENELLTTVKARIEKATWSGYDIVGSISPEQCDSLAELDQQLKPDEIWISISMGDRVQLDDLRQSLRHSVANIRLLPDLMMYQTLNHGMTVNVGIPMVDISVTPMFGTARLIKMVEDYVVSSAILVLISPLLCAIAIAVKLTSKGPVLFKQKRHGWNDVEIYVYKFRSMYVHEEHEGQVTQAQKHDSRVTPLGRFLRRTSLDELPQFINVLQGRMSVVGPRPHALRHNQEYMQLIPKYALRHKVKPGITGWAQVCGHRGETDTIDKMEARIKHDIYYLEHWSLWLDLKIIFLTPLATIQNKNVY